MKKDLLSIVIPCYNEEQVIGMFYDEMIHMLNSNKLDYELIFVDDGSVDGTLEQIKKFHNNNNKVSIISFSRNFGKESAIYAGLYHSKGDLVVVMDADLEHPPKFIPQMIGFIQEGYDTVTTQRVSRLKESFFKNKFSNLFYSLMNKFSEVDIVNGAQDFRMMKRIVVNAILQLEEYNRFSKGIFSWVGFKVKYIQVEDVKRPKGETKWNYHSLFNYAIEGILAFSTAPLKIATFLGLLISGSSFIFILKIVIESILGKTKVPGYPSLMVIILFLGGIQIFLIGIVSEYLAKIYYEIKARPSYIIKEHIGQSERTTINEK